MELHFQNPGFDYMLEQILAFQDEDASPFWSAPISAARSRRRRDMTLTGTSITKG